MTSALRIQPLVRVLLVDDEPEVCAFLAEELGQAGYELFCVGNDLAAYEALKRDWRSFSVIILDVNLGPGTTGFDVARYARRLSPSLPVIFTTGFNSEDSVERYGVSESVFVAKPFTGLEMLRAVQELGARPRS